jgi:hypothetical protein
MNDKMGNIFTIMTYLTGSPHETWNLILVSSQEHADMTVNFILRACDSIRENVMGGKCVVKREMHIKFWLGNRQGRGHVGDLAEQRSIISKYVKK